MKFIFAFAVICASLIALSSGARYVGTSAADAERILDKSQGVKPFGSNAKGHPRGHAKGPSTGRAIDSLQDFSKKSKLPKTGFKFRDQQNDIVHRALKHPLCQAKFTLLNGPNKPENENPDCTVPAAEIVPNSVEVEEWLLGNWVRTGPMRQVVIVLGHFQGQENNPNADVHIRTAYPTM